METFFTSYLACWFLGDWEKLTPNDKSLLIYSKSALIELKREFYGFFFTFAALALADSRVSISDSVGVCGLSSGSVEISSCP